MMDKKNKNSIQAKAGSIDAKHPRDARGRFVKKGA
jgi:hypothetical protein